MPSYLLITVQLYARNVNKTCLRQIGSLLSWLQSIKRLWNNYIYNCKTFKKKCNTLIPNENWNTYNIKGFPVIQWKSRDKVIVTSKYWSIESRSLMIYYLLLLILNRLFAAIDISFQRFVKILTIIVIMNWFIKYWSLNGQLKNQNW